MRKFEKIREDDAIIPIRSTKGSGGYDFFANADITIYPHCVELVPTGIKAQFESDEVLQLYNRSSNPIKRGLMLANGVGIVDSDYYGNSSNDGEIMFAFYNFLDLTVQIKKGEKIGQGIFMKYLMVDDDNAKGERSGGWGSTGA